MEHIMSAAVPNLTNAAYCASLQGPLPPNTFLTLAPGFPSRKWQFNTDTITNNQAALELRLVAIPPVKCSH